jgi:electron transport complex protein RnfB
MHVVITAEQVDALLPQTQCTRCGFDGCRPYAEAIASGTSAINRCPPGGETTLAALATLTGRAPLPLDRTCGEHIPLQLAVIDESVCIGCTLCIDACPVDAILGAPKRMHAILPSLCSGCELCVAPCPVDCITMIDARRPWTPDDAAAARIRYEARNKRVSRNERIARRRPRDVATHQDDIPPKNAAVEPIPKREDKQREVRAAAIAQALARARARRGSPPSS